MSDSFATPWTVSLPGSSVHGIFQAGILEWVAISSSRGSSEPRESSEPGIEPKAPALTGGFFTTEPPGKAQYQVHRYFRSDWNRWMNEIESIPILSRSQENVERSENKCECGGARSGEWLCWKKTGEALSSTRVIGNHLVAFRSRWKMYTFLLPVTFLPRNVVGFYFHTAS